MAPHVAWWVHRLRAMSLAEVAHRTKRLARHPLEVAQMRTGRYAAPSPAVRAHLDAWTGPAAFYFSAQRARLAISPALLATADAICDGKVDVLGLGPITVPRDPWHHEPRTGGTWPMLASARILRAPPPGFDARLTWELNRGHAWVVLARAHAATGTRRYRDELLRQLVSWIQHNPVGVGINWASALEAALRIHTLAWTAGFLRSSAPELLPTIAHALHTHAVFVADHLSEHSSANNHLLVELSGLVVAGRVLGSDELHATWVAPALARLDSELVRQTLPGGVNAEMATHYHAFVLEAMLLVAWLERAHGTPRPRLEIVIAAMAIYLDALCCENGGVLGQGDSDDGAVLPWFARDAEKQLVAAAAALRTPHPPAHEPAPDLEGAYWITGGAARAPAPVPVQMTSHRFGASGQVVLRSPRVHLAFDAGPFGLGPLAAHAHCDALAIYVALDGQRVLVDRGTYRYNGDDAARDAYRLTAAHSTVQVGTRDQATPRGPFLWSRQPNVVLERCELRDIDLVQGTHDGFLPIQHRRALVRTGDVVVVIDTLVGARGGAPAVARFHFAPELAIAQRPTTGGTWLDVTRDGRPIAVLWTDATGVRIAEWSHSPAYGAQLPAPTSEHALADRALVTAIAPADVPPDAIAVAITTARARAGVH